jgi:selenocysteine lyase/cysteine desulfurase
MGIENILKREEEIVSLIFERIGNIPNLHILADNHQHRMGVISFYIDGLHFNLGVKMLNDRFGIQMRGGCSCAGTYGHILLHIPEEVSNEITHQIDSGDFSHKPGWIRFSIHPTMTNAEILEITDALIAMAENHQEWARDYEYLPKTNEFSHKSGDLSIASNVNRIMSQI